MPGEVAEYRSITSDIKSSAWVSRLRALFAFMTIPGLAIHRERTRRTTPLLSSGVERVNDPRSGTVFRAESDFIGIGGTSTR